MFSKYHQYSTDQDSEPEYVKYAWDINYYSCFWILLKILITDGLFFCLSQANFL